MGLTLKDMINNEEYELEEGKTIIIGKAPTRTKGEEAQLIQLLHRIKKNLK